MINAEHEPLFAIRAIPDRTLLYQRLSRLSSFLTGGEGCRHGNFR